FLSLALPTILMGMSLPLLVRATVRDAPHAARAIGLLYGLNVLGACAGALVTPWFLVRFYGIREALLVAAAGNLLAAFAGLAAARPAGSPARATPAATPAPAPAPWDPVLRLVLRAVGRPSLLQPGGRLELAAGVASLPDAAARSLRPAHRAHGRRVHGAAARGAPRRRGRRAPRGRAAGVQHRRMRGREPRGGAGRPHLGGIGGRAAAPGPGRPRFRRRR